MPARLSRIVGCRSQGRSWIAYVQRLGPFGQVLLPERTRVCVLRPTATGRIVDATQTSRSEEGVPGHDIDHERRSELRTKAAGLR